MGTTIIGRGSFISGGVKNTFPVSNLYVGQFTSIATGLTVMLGGNHSTNLLTTANFVNLMPDKFGGLPNPFPPTGLTKGDIIIDNDVWIGQDVTIMSGVHIHSGAIVGTAAVIAKDIPPYAMVVGNPGRIIKYRFEPEIIERLLRIAWWNWDIDKIYENYSYFIDPDIIPFVDKFDPR